MPKFKTGPRFFEDHLIQAAGGNKLDVRTLFEQRHVVKRRPPTATNKTDPDLMHGDPFGIHIVSYEWLVAFTISCIVSASRTALISAALKATSFRIATLARCGCLIEIASRISRCAPSDCLEEPGRRTVISRLVAKAARMACAICLNNSFLLASRITSWNCQVGAHIDVRFLHALHHFIKCTAQPLQLLFASPFRRISGGLRLDG